MPTRESEITDHRLKSSLHLSTSGRKFLVKRSLSLRGKKNSQIGQAIGREFKRKQGRRQGQSGLIKRKRADLALEIVSRSYLAWRAERVWSRSGEEENEYKPLIFLILSAREASSPRDRLLTCEEYEII